MDKEKQQYDKMVNTPIKKLVLKLAIPTIISMLVTSIYNLADTLFVSSLGESVSGAISIVFPIMTIIQAVGFTLGMGAGSLISAKLGKEENDEAKSIGSIAFYTSLAFGFLILIFGLVFGVIGWLSNRSNRKKELDDAMIEYFRNKAKEDKEK